uniref:NADH-ubiquinone oxidoreductase chain 5 n=1 Tax=Rena humilis TaxID=711330 RepID=Q6I7X7_RENHU|nr:NADH dehydrogenase subunit 5 [Rena humilis]BAD24747.1 NADH dehydrogenase subunit 5 [Rena humilis]
MSTLIPGAILLSIPIILAIPITKTMIPNQTMDPKLTKLTLKVTCLLSLIPLTSSLQKTETHVTIMTYMQMNTLNLNLNTTLDQQTTVFTTTALFITWAIVEFSTWYMKKDPKINTFIKYLTMFLLAMFTIITANNMFQLTIGWEAVGMMSFLLIGWWHARTGANIAALQAIIYNRIGDIGILMALAWLLLFSSWDLKELMQEMNTLTLTPLLALILAAVGKSAQFGLHPWLPAAMEGPTPVSALLHSSTMVVAGMYLLIRLHPAIKTNQTALSMCLIIGTTTALFAAIAATSQNDIKKIIALSTTSHLGLMMTALGLNKPTVALLHLTMHSFFKALMFLCAGSYIHNLNNEQDTRKMGGTQRLLPFTSSTTTIASLALIGTPFLSGFYSKDAIIETATSSSPNAWALLTTTIATSFSTAYTIRLIMTTQTHFPRLTQNHNHPETHNMTKPLIRLTIGTITAGLMTKLSPLSETTTTFPHTAKLAAPTLLVLATMCTLDIKNLSMKNPPKKHNPTMFFNQMMFFNTLHRALPTKTLKYSQKISTELMDLWLLENLAPKGIEHATLSMIHLADKQKKQIKTYLSNFTTTVVIMLIIIATHEI